MKHIFYSGILTILITLSSGCQSELGVTATNKEDWLKSRVVNPLIGMGMSYRVKNYLTEESLWDEYNSDHNALLKSLNKRFNGKKDQDTLLALIELNPPPKHRSAPGVVR